MKHVRFIACKPALARIKVAPGERGDPLYPGDVLVGVGILAAFLTAFVTTVATVVQEKKESD